ncbi:MAG: hypothetical protein NPIRA03_28860 [Nitrospirales bacterium]|nr:MAG: hypothetical protein NPIRA03_28860 [Nitrospirales bacterium]
MSVGIKNVPTQTVSRALSKYMYERWIRMDRENHASQLIRGMWLDRKGEIESLVRYPETPLQPKIIFVVGFFLEAFDWDQF